jgi:hypothetical protein
MSHRTSRPSSAQAPQAPIAEQPVSTEVVDDAKVTSAQEQQDLAQIDAAFASFPLRPEAQPQAQQDQPQPDDQPDDQPEADAQPQAQQDQPQAKLIKAKDYAPVPNKAANDMTVAEILAKLPPDKPVIEGKDAFEIYASVSQEMIDMSNFVTRVESEVEYKAGARYILLESMHAFDAKRKDEWSSFSRWCDAVGPFSSSDASKIKKAFNEAPEFLRVHGRAADKARQEARVALGETSYVAWMALALNGGSFNGKPIFIRRRSAVQLRELTSLMKSALNAAEADAAKRKLIAEGKLNPDGSPLRSTDTSTPIVTQPDVQPEAKRQVKLPLGITFEDEEETRIKEFTLPNPETVLAYNPDAFLAIPELTGEDRAAINLDVFKSACNTVADLSAQIAALMEKRGLFIDAAVNAWEAASNSDTDADATKMYLTLTTTTKAVAAERAIMARQAEIAKARKARIGRHAKSIFATGSLESGLSCSQDESDAAYKMAEEMKREAAAQSGK